MLKREKEEEKAAREKEKKASKRTNEKNAGKQGTDASAGEGRWMRRRSPGNWAAWRLKNEAAPANKDSGTTDKKEPYNRKQSDSK